MSKTIPICRHCKAELNKENWYPSQEKRNIQICKSCNIAYVKNRQRLNGMRPFNENKECSLYLGVHVAERVLSQVFDYVKVMPMNNPGYDLICNRKMLIDVKSACRCTSPIRNDRWSFYTRENQIADYFLCLAFDNRKDLNPEHIWLIPRKDVNNSHCITVAVTKTDKWDKYALKIDEITSCCADMKG